MIATQCHDPHQLFLRLPSAITNSVTAAACTIQVILKAIVVVFARLVISRMTARAGRRVARGRPVDGIRIGIMAFRTLEVAAVIERLISQTGVVEVRRCPTIRGMALATIYRRTEMTRVHSSRISAIVTGRTGAQNLVVVDRVCWYEYRGVVAVFADIGRKHVSRSFAGGVTTIVATGAIIRDVGMVKVRRSPGDGRVAVIAIVATRDVRRVLADRRGAVMARAANADDLSMIDSVRRYPCIRRMTVFTNSAGLNMRWRLAGGINAIVAAGTITSDVDVIKVGR